jgi:hypothetical protein
MGGIVRRQNPASQLPKQGLPQAKLQQPSAPTTTPTPVQGLKQAQPARPASGGGGGGGNYHAPDGSVWNTKAMYDEYQARLAADKNKPQATAPTPAPQPAPAPAAPAEPTPTPVEGGAGGAELPAAAVGSGALDSAALAGLQAAATPTTINPTPMADELGLYLGQRTPPQYDNILAGLRRIY